MVTENYLCPLNFMCTWSEIFGYHKYQVFMRFLYVFFFVFHLVMTGGARARIETRRAAHTFVLLNRLYFLSWTVSWLKI